MHNSSLSWNPIPVVTALLLVAASVLLGCSSTVGPGQPFLGDSSGLDDNPFARPDLVQQRITQDRLLLGVWIPGTHRVVGQFPTVGEFCSLDLLDVDSLSITPLTQDALCGGSDLQWLSVSPDGAVLFYLHADSLNDTSPMTIRRLSFADHQTTDVITLPAGAESFSLSPDGREIVYTAYHPDSVGFRLRDLTTGSDTLLVRSTPTMYMWNGARFSPDGSELVFVDSLGIRLHRFSIATGVAQFAPGPGMGGNPFEWTPIGIQYVAVVPCPICLEPTNVMTGERLGLHLDQAVLAWSADGLHIAGATPWCSDFGCSQERTEVAVADWATHQATVIARENCFGLPGLVVSPDGKTVIYGLCSGTYIWKRP